MDRGELTVNTSVEGLYVGSASYDPTLVITAFNRTSSDCEINDIMVRSRDEKNHMKMQNILLIWVTVLLIAGCATDTKAPQSAPPQSAPTGVLAVQYLNDCRLYGGAAVLDIRVTNRSSYLLDYWEVNIEVSDASGKFIGTSFNNGLNLAADGNVVSKFNLRDVSCGAIKDKKVSLIKIVTVERGGQKNFDAVRFFKLVVE